MNMLPRFHPALRHIAEQMTDWLTKALDEERQDALDFMDCACSYDNPDDLCKGHRRLFDRLLAKREQANPARPPWPAEAKFSFGDKVEYIHPYYSFPGTICGWYRRADGGLGYAVSRDGDPGNVEHFGETRLRLRLGKRPPGPSPTIINPPDLPTEVIAKWWQTALRGEVEEVKQKQREEWAVSMLRQADSVGFLDKSLEAWYGEK